MIFLSSSRVYSIKNLRKLVNKKKINTPLKIKKKIRENFETSLERRNCFPKSTLFMALQN